MSHKAINSHPNTPFKPLKVLLKCFSQIIVSQYTWYTWWYTHYRFKFLSQFERDQEIGKKLLPQLVSIAVFIRALILDADSESDSKCQHEKWPMLLNGSVCHATAHMRSSQQVGLKCSFWLAGSRLRLVWESVSVINIFKCCCLFDLQVCCNLIINYRQGGFDYQSVLCN